LISAATSKNNQLIRKTVLKMYPSGFIATLTGGIALTISSMIAGFLLGKDAIAAVAIGTPIVGIFQALTQMVTNGVAVKLAVYAGRSDHRGMNRIFSLGIAATAFLGVLFVAVCQLCATALVNAFGASGNAEMAHQAALFLRANSICIIMGSFNMYFTKILTLYGYHSYVFRSAMTGMIGNVIFSALYVKLLPTDFAIVGLGAGMWSGGFFAALLGLLAIKKKKIPLKFKLDDVDIKAFPEIVRLGIPTSGNNLADGVVSGVINNIIVSGFGGDYTALAVYTAVKGVFTFGIVAAIGAAASAAPLMGILYGARDRSALLKTVGESFKVGLAASVIWCGILIALRPVLAGFYGMQGNAYFQSGVLFCLMFTPLHLIMRIFIQLFESTEKITMGLLYSIVPDSVIYPLMLAALIPTMKYSGLWLSYAANPIPFVIILFIVRSIKNKTFKPSWDRMLCLDESIKDNVPMLDISIKSDNTDVTGISEKVHSFLTEQNASSRTAYMTSLCLEELAADFVAHTPEKVKSDRVIMDIKLFSDEDAFKVVIRNSAPAYNPLNFELNDQTFSKVGVKLAQKVAKKIEYNYVYRINIVTITVEK